MKKLVCLLLILFMWSAVSAESSALPVRILEHEEAAVSLTDALTKAKAAIGETPEQAMIRAELVELSDGSKVWVVTLFDVATLTEAWCVTLDASTGAVIAQETGEGGFFAQTHAAWTAAKGPQPLWSLEDKQRYDALYALLPAYGLPMNGDLSAEQALERALFVLGLESAAGYEVGYGYLMGGEGYNGVWEISLVRNGEIICQINLDAVTGEVYYMQDEEAGNG